MSTLRDRLIALAGEMLLDPLPRDIEQLALAAARMAPEDAAQACREKAQHDYMESAILKPGIELLRRVAMGNRCDDCAEDIRALRDGLE